MSSPREEYRRTFIEISLLWFLTARLCKVLSTSYVLANMGSWVFAQHILILARRGRHLGDYLGVAQATVC